MPVRIPPHRHSISDIFPPAAVGVPVSKFRFASTLVLEMRDDVISLPTIPTSKTYPEGKERYGIVIDAIDDGLGDDGVRSDLFGILFRSRSKKADQGGVAFKIENKGSTDACYIINNLRPTGYDASGPTLPTGYDSGGTGIGLDHETTGAVFIPTIRVSVDPNTTPGATKGIWIIGADKYLDGSLPPTGMSGKYALPIVVDDFSRSCFEAYMANDTPDGQDVFRIFRWIDRAAGTKDLLFAIGLQTDKTTQIINEAGQFNFISPDSGGTPRTKFNTSSSGIEIAQWAGLDKSWELKFISTTQNLIMVNAAGNLQFWRDGESYPRFVFKTDTAEIQFGPGTADVDTILYRRGPDQLQTDDEFWIWGRRDALNIKGQSTPRIMIQPSDDLNLSYDIFAIRHPSSGYDWFYITKDGALNWGSGTEAVDANLYRSAASVLKTNSKFVLSQLWKEDADGADFWIRNRVASSAYWLRISTLDSLGSDVERIRITNYVDTAVIALLSSNVGIGTGTPGAALHISGTGWGAGQRWTTEGVAAQTWGLYIHDDEGRLTFSDLVADRLVITPGGGYVGIGATSPAEKLTVVDADHTRIKVETTGVAKAVELRLAHEGTDYWSISSRGTLDAPNYRLAIYSGPTWAERLTILKDGKVGIGTASPVAKLHIEGGLGLNRWLELRNSSGRTGEFFINAQASDLSIPAYGAIVRYANNGWDAIDGGLAGDNTSAIEILTRASTPNTATFTKISSEAGPIVFGTGGADPALARMIITNDGNVGIGATDPSEAKLVVAGNVNLRDSFLKFDQQSLATKETILARVSGDTAWRFTIYADGKIYWGPGAAGQDVNLYRGGADILKTDNQFHTQQVRILVDDIDAMSIRPTSDLSADATNTLRDSSRIQLRGRYWDGASSIDRDAHILHDMVSTTPTSRIKMMIAGADYLRLGDADFYLRGSDVELYRSGAGTLKTLSKFIASELIKDMADGRDFWISLRLSNSAYWMRFSTRDSIGADSERIRITNYVDTANICLLNSNVGVGVTSPVTTLDVNGDIRARMAISIGGKIWFGTWGAEDTNLYRFSGNQLATDDDFIIFSTDLQIRNNSAVIKLGSALDVNLYRSAANVLKTDHKLLMDGLGVTRVSDDALIELDNRSATNQVRAAGLKITTKATAVDTTCGLVGWNQGIGDFAYIELTTVNRDVGAYGGTGIAIDIKDGVSESATPAYAYQSKLYGYYDIGLHIFTDPARTATCIQQLIHLKPRVGAVGLDIRDMGGAGVLISLGVASSGGSNKIKWFNETVTGVPYFIHAQTGGSAEKMSWRYGDNATAEHDVLTLDKNANIVAWTPGAGGYGFWVERRGEANPRAKLEEDRVSFGPGGASSLDTFLVRVGGNQLSGSADNVLELGTDTVRLKRVRAVNVVTGHLSFQEKICHVCGGTFKKGETLKLTVVDVEKETKCLPVHEYCLGG